MSEPLIYRLCQSADLSQYGFHSVEYARTRLEQCTGGYVLHVNPPGCLKTPLSAYHIYTDFQSKVLLVPASSHHTYTLPEPAATAALTLLQTLFNTIGGDIETLEHMDAQLNVLEDDVLNSHVPKNFSHKMVKLRRNVIHLRQYYEQLIEVLAVMEEHQLVSTEEEMTTLHRLNRRLNRLFSLLTDLREYALGVQDAYQAKSDYDLNNLMKTFTIITTIMLPLQLITGWFGMNLIMPEVQWAYAYPIVILVCILIVILCTLFFRKKKWL